MSTKQQKLEEIVRPVVEGLDYIFWGLEFLAQGRHSVLRVFIDHENGVNVEDCATVSRQLSSVLDVEDPIQANYNLEVSSPGLDRRLFTEEQYGTFRGETVDIRLNQAFEGQRRFTGILNGVEDGSVLLIVDSEEYLLPLELIDKSRIIPQFD